MKGWRHLLLIVPCADLWTRPEPFPPMAVDCRELWPGGHRCVWRGRCRCDRSRWHGGLVHLFVEPTWIFWICLVPVPNSLSLPFYNGLLLRLPETVTWWIWWYAAHDGSLGHTVAWSHTWSLLGSSSMPAFVFQKESCSLLQKILGIFTGPWVYHTQYPYLVLWNLPGHVA